VRRLPPCGLLAALLVAALPGTAPAAQRRAQPLIDVPPAPGARMVDRVVRDVPRALRARAAQASGRTTVVRAADGQPVRVTVSSAYAADPAVAASYVKFLSDLPHGSELRRLRMRIVTPGAVASSCGAQPSSGVLACYLPRANLMVVPGEQPPDDDVSQAYIVAHEYGHHIANHRSNAPFDALDFGPKRWASQQDVCHQWLADRLVPGDEGDFYRLNPGEAWAETYAQLTYPQEWRYSELLRPTSAGNVAALRDVGEPWRADRRQAFRGRLGRLDGQDRHSFRLRLDGTLRVQLEGPRTANYDLVLRANGRLRGRTRATGSRDRLGWQAACVQAPETITVTVRRRSGAGPYTLRVRWAG
jgi:hypothetical protein